MTEEFLRIRLLKVILGQFKIVEISYAIALLTALMTRSQISGMSIYRVGLFIPQIMSAVVVGVIWRWLFAFDGPISLTEFFAET